MSSRDNSDNESIASKSSRTSRSSRLSDKDRSSVGSRGSRKSSTSTGTSTSKIAKKKRALADVFGKENLDHFDVRDTELYIRSRSMLVLQAIIQRFLKSKYFKDVEVDMPKVREEAVAVIKDVASFLHDKCRSKRTPIGTTSIEKRLTASRLVKSRPYRGMDMPEFEDLVRNATVVDSKGKGRSIDAFNINILEQHKNLINGTIPTLLKGSRINNPNAETDTDIHLGIAAVQNPRNYTVFTLSDQAIEFFRAMGELTPQVGNVVKYLAANEATKIRKMAEFFETETIYPFMSYYKHLRNECDSRETRTRFLPLMSLYCMSFAANCLIAKKMAENGKAPFNLAQKIFRNFIQLYSLAMKTEEECEIAKKINELKEKKDAAKEKKKRYEEAERPEKALAQEQIIQELKEEIASLRPTPTQASYVVSDDIFPEFRAFIVAVDAANKKSKTPLFAADKNARQLLEKRKIQLKHFKFVPEDVPLKKRETVSATQITQILKSVYMFPKKDAENTAWKNTIANISEEQPYTSEEFFNETGYTDNFALYAIAASTFSDK